MAFAYSNYFEPFNPRFRWQKKISHTLWSSPIRHSRPPTLFPSEKKSVYIYLSEHTRSDSSDCLSACKCIFRVIRNWYIYLCITYIYTTHVYTLQNRAHSLTRRAVRCRRLDCSSGIIHSFGLTTATTLHSRIVELKARNPEGWTTYIHEGWRIPPSYTPALLYHILFSV